MNENCITLSWAETHEYCKELAAVLFANDRRYSGVYGIPTGGCFVAHELHQWLADLPLLDAPQPGCLVVDDLIDTGTTMARYLSSSDSLEPYTCAALFRKPHSFNGRPDPVVTVCVTSDWVQFPWETNHPRHLNGGPTDAVIRLLEFILAGTNGNPLSYGKTPARVLASLTEMTCGYHQNPDDLLDAIFEVPYDEVVLLRHIPFCSLCEHHMLAFSGTADVAYLPAGRIVGVSKLARLVDCFAQRLQIQERLTYEVAQALLESDLKPQGVAVVMRAAHSCMACRGVKKSGAEMVTSAMLGVFRDKPEARAELMALLGGKS